MDEESVRLKHRLRAEIDATRDELGMYISELDRRRHAALDVKHQIRTHPRVVIGVGVAIVAAAAGGVAMLVRARKQKRAGRSVRRALSRFAPPRSSEPGRMISLVLRSALPFAVAAARRFLRRTQTRRLELERTWPSARGSSFSPVSFGGSVSGRKSPGAIVSAAGMERVPHAGGHPRPG